jgi:hypothetical protein
VWICEPLMRAGDASSFIKSFVEAAEHE